MDSKAIAIDFDGVIHKYSNGWKDGTCYDEPIENAIESLVTLYDNGFKVIIYSTRGRIQILDYITKHFNRLFPQREMIDIEITNIKPMAIAYIDDRGIRFTNWKDMLKYFI
jgi:histidinol phosphatase-like enzyme